MPDLPDPTIHHLPRPVLPWAHEAHALTECGMLVSDAKHMTTVPEAQALVKRLGIARALYNLCRTCVDTANRYGTSTFSERPIDVMRRSLDGLGLDRYRSRNRAAERSERVTVELHAIAALIEAHRDEFDSYIAGRAEAVDLAALRRAKRRRSP